MNRQTLFVLSMLVLTTAVVAVPAGTVSAATQEGLESVLSPKLDDVYLRPNANLAGYRQVMVEPAQVAFRKNWLKDINSTRDLSRWLVPEDAQRILDEAASSMRSTVADTFKEAGYQIAVAPGPGVLRVSPRVADLDVFAPDVEGASPQRLFTKLTAGEATLILELRDSVSGNLLGRVVDRRTAREVGRFNRATSVSNLMWFDVMFRQWATNCIAEIEGVKGSS
jgi:hypothetical protein